MPACFNNFVDIINKQKLKNYIKKVGEREPDSGFTLFGGKTAGEKKVAAEALYNAYYGDSYKSALKKHEDTLSGGELKEIHDEIMKSSKR